MKPLLQILRKSLLTGAREARGVAVVIDVLRAFTCAAFMVHFGAEKIVLQADPEGILKLKQEKGYLAVGEVGGRMVPGFDLGNSPSQIVAAGRDLFAGRTVAQRTSAGVTGAVTAAEHSDLVILGSFVTARAIARYIQGLSPPPEVVSLVAMGLGGKEVTPDDETCADYIEHLLSGRPFDSAQGRPFDSAAALQQVVEHECVQKFLRGDQPHFPPSDPSYCLQRDLFDFVLVATLKDGQLTARRVDVPKE